MAERGSGPRTSRARPRRVDINLEFDSVDRLGEYVSNISKTGCFIRTQDPWPVGTPLNLRFTVLLDDPEILEGTGEVVRVSESPRGMGVRFVQLPLRSRKLVEQLLARKPARRQG
jgi:uncharacterized protein (TIGR02266 family)